MEIHWMSFWIGIFSTTGGALLGALIVTKGKALKEIAIGTWQGLMQ